MVYELGGGMGGVGFDPRPRSWGLSLWFRGDPVGMELGKSYDTI